MLKLFLISLTLLLTFNACGSNSDQDYNTSSPSSNISDYDKILQLAFDNQEPKIQVYGIGKVIELLPDDTIGSRHQKFIIKLASGQTLLISHNIDLAMKIDTLSLNDTIEFYGEYKWNEKGGLIHWTHDDPDNKHIDGWLKHKGTTYR
ncbi:MAG: DUF3465 domain-containing protein [Sulfurovum sp.]|nr:DUF3465 domain-containing protein [Sulfurovum sp.]